MKIATTDVDVDLGQGAEIPRHFPVVVDDGACRQIVLALRAAQLPVRISGLGHYTRHYCGQSFAGQRLLAWRGCGIGDQLMAAGVLRSLARRRPGGMIEFWCAPQVYRELWWGVGGLPFVPRPEPIPFAASWRRADWHLILEEMCEADSEPDQECAWDRMLWAAGLDPATIPDVEKRPLIPMTAADCAAAAAWLRNAFGGATPAPPAKGHAALCTPEGQRLSGRVAGAEPHTASPLILWQVGASTPLRGYPPAATREAVRMLAERLPQARIVLIASDKTLAEYAPLPLVTERVVACVGQPLRTVFALAAQAACTVAPDSVLGHVAGGLDVPCVGLWSSFHPKDRVKYYPRHLPLYQPVDCSPCRIHECGEQKPGCPKPTGPWCKGVAAIPPGAIGEAVLSVLSAVKAPDVSPQRTQRPQRGKKTETLVATGSRPV